MIFIDPSLEEIYQTLLDNDELIDFLKENYLLSSRSKLYNDYSIEEVDSMAEIIFSENVATLYDVARVLLKYKDEIKSNTVWNLVSNHVGWDELANALGLMSKDMTTETYKNIIFCYKYCSVSSFFQNNKEKFLPENDFIELENNPAAYAFYDAMMKEFDKLDSIIGKCCEYLDYDKIPWDLITYLTQLLGFEKNTFNIEDEIKFREIAKNILDLYRMKGTSYSFELFFSFLGFNIKIKEFYFDRRMFHSRLTGNPETGSSNAFTYEFYLTTSDPAKNELSGTCIDEVVWPSDITKQYSLDEFNELCKIYDPAAVLGYSPVYTDEDGKLREYTGKVYKYFKTNSVYYDIGLDEGNVTAKQQRIIAKCLDFLTPSYIAKRFKVDTFTGGTDDSIGFDGDGTKIPDQNGNYGKFEMLDEEDWDQHFEDQYIYIKGGNQIGITDSKNYNDKEETFLPYTNSLGGKQFRLPIKTRIINKSMNRFLTGADGSPHLTGQRLKYYLAKSSSSTLLIPYYSVPPFVNLGPGQTYENIENNFWEDTQEARDRRKDLIGPNSVKEQLKYIHSVRDIDFITDKPIKEFIKTDTEFNDLVPIRTMNRTMNLISSIKYGDGTKYISDKDGEAIVKCFNDNFLNMDISNVDKSSISDSLTKFTRDNLFNYDSYTYKNLTYGKLFAVYDGDINKGTIYIYLYGNYKMPIKKQIHDGKKVYNLNDYRIYIDSFDYDISLYYDNTSGEQISLPFNFLTKNTLEDVRQDIQKSITEMKNKFNNNPLDYEKWYDLDYITNKIYYVRDTRKYYTPVRAPIPSAYSKMTRDCGVNHSQFKTLEEAKKHFNDHPDDKICNTEFFVNGDNYFDDASIDHPYLYTLTYKHNRKNLLVYSTSDEKLYVINNNSEYGFEEYKDFFGKLRFFKKDQNGNYIIKNGIMIEAEGSDTGDRYSEGISDNVSDMVSFIDIYDEAWKGYDEQADYEDFIGYNSEHIIQWPAGGYPEPTRITRPIKELTDKIYDVSPAILSDNVSRSMGESMIIEILSHTMDRFTFSEQLGWEKNYYKVPSSIAIDDPSYYELYEIDSQGNFTLTKDKTSQPLKDYYTLSVSGLTSIAENGAEQITGKDLFDEDYDYYSSSSDFILDYYKIIMGDNYDVKNFPDTFIKDFIGERTSFEDAEKNKIKKYYNIAIMQMASVMDMLYKSRVFYFKGLIDSELYGTTTWKTASEAAVIKGQMCVWTDKLKYYCPGLYALWLNDPLACDPFNIMFIDINDKAKREKYFIEHGLENEIDGYERYIENIITPSYIIYLTQSEKHNIRDNFYPFEEKTLFVKRIEKNINGLSKAYDGAFVSLMNEELLGKDAYSTKYKRYEDYLYIDSEEKEHRLNIYLSNDINGNLFIPYSFSYGINKFSKDYTGEFREIYSEASEIISIISNGLSNPVLGKIDLDEFLKQYYYNNLLNLYRSKYMEDNEPIKYNLDRKNGIPIYPKLRAKIDGSMGTFKDHSVFNNSYINNGGKRDTDVRLPFNKFYASVDKSRNARLSFDVSCKDFAKCYGFIFNRFNDKEIINRYSGEEKKKFIEELKKLYKKQLSAIKPIFMFTENSNSYYSSLKKRTNWQRVRTLMSKEYSSSDIEYYLNGSKVINDNGDVIDNSGKVITDNIEVMKRLGEIVESGNVRIVLLDTLTFKDENILEDYKDFLYDKDKESFNILEKDSSYITGYLSVNNLRPLYIDNRISFPESMKWIEIDENKLPKEFISFGDDKKIDIIKNFSDTNDETITNDTFNTIINNNDIINVCEVYKNAYGKVIVKIPSNIMHTSEIKEIEVYYDDGK